MELTPLYTLRDRLKAGAIAGTALMGEDFRLVRALEALAPLESASPIFQKIGQGVRALLAADCPDRASALLDALSLCDAVLTTQGSVGVSGSLGPIPLTMQGSAVTNAPYSVLNPLMEALTSSGGGRYALIVDTHDQRPELFRDYRVKRALVTALGAAYYELAERAEEWLSENGPEIAPLLKAGFNPTGKREMVRRIHVLENVCGRGENEFYLSLLDDSEKEVRAAAIYALRHDEGNVQRLVELCKTEKGAGKKAAHWALAQFDSPVAWDYWNALVAKKPEQATGYMALSTTSNASALVGGALCDFLALYESRKGTWNANAYELLTQLLRTLAGKAGPQICDFYRRAAALGTLLDSKLEDNEDKKETAHFAGGNGFGRVTMPFSAALPDLLRYSLVLNPASDLCDLAQELFSKYGGGWAGAALTAILLSKEGTAALDAARPLLKPNFSLLSGKAKKQMTQAVSLALEALHWVDGKKTHTVSLWFWDPMIERNITVCRPLPQRLDPAWFSELANFGTEFDNVLIRCMDPNDRETGAILAKHLHTSALANGSNIKYLRPLRQLGWTDYRGLLVCNVKGQKRPTFWQVREYLNELALCGADRVAELEEFVRQVEAGKIGLQGGYSVSDLKALIVELKPASEAQ